MAFKLFEKGVYGLRNCPSDTISLNKTSISVGEKFKTFFERTTHVEIYVDEEKGMIALKPTNDKVRAFPLRWENRRGQISVPIVRRSGVVRGNYKAEIINDMLIAKDIPFKEEEEEETKNDTFEFQK